MAGLIPFRGGVIARRITKVGEHSNPVIRSFIIFLRRVSHKEWSIKFDVSLFFLFPASAI